MPSGVFIRCANPSEIGAATCYEVNIFDQRPDPAYRTGGIVDVARPNVMIETGDRWNTYEISAHGSHLSVKLNGQTTVDTNDEKLAAGPFALQYGAGRVRFRNVRIRADESVLPSVSGPSRGDCMSGQSCSKRTRPMIPLLQELDSQPARDGGVRAERSIVGEAHGYGRRAGFTCAGARCGYRNGY
jgi:hypothetical protein